MLTDVQIAQSAEMKPIKEIAAQVGLHEDDLELYGKYKAKISLEAIKKAGYKLTTPMIICNSNDYSSINIKAVTSISKGEKIIEIK